MADLPSEPAVDPRLREFLAAELRQAELDFPHLPRPERVRARRRLPIGFLAAAVAVLAFVVVAPPFLGTVFEGTAGTPMGADGLPLSINGEPVLRGEAIASHAGDGGFLAGGTLVLDTSPSSLDVGTGADRLRAGLDPCVGPALGPCCVVRARWGGNRTRLRAHVRRAHGRPGRVAASAGGRSPRRGGGRVAPADEGAHPRRCHPGRGRADQRGTGAGLRVRVGPRWRHDRRVRAEADSAPSRDDAGWQSIESAQDLPQPVYGEDLATLVGHMVPGVGFVALGSTDVPPGASASVAAASVAPSPPFSAPPASASAAPSGWVGSSNRGLREDLAARMHAGHCPGAGGPRPRSPERTPSSWTTPAHPALSSADRLYPFASVVVFVTAGAARPAGTRSTLSGLSTTRRPRPSPGPATVPAHVVHGSWRRSPSLNA